MAYLPWLLWQIVLSSLQVAYVVLHPKMPIQPGDPFPDSLPHTLARLTLATSITLTPGTITIDVQDDDVRGACPNRSRGAVARPAHGQRRHAAAGGGHLPAPRPQRRQDAPV